VADSLAESRQATDDRSATTDAEAAEAADHADVSLASAVQA
jgi:hypothetical protein